MMKVTFKHASHRPVLAPNIPEALKMAELSDVHWMAELTESGDFDVKALTKGKEWVSIAHACLVTAPA